MHFIISLLVFVCSKKICEKLIKWLAPFQVLSSETEKSGHVKQSAKNKRFPLEKGNKEAKRIHQKQSNKKSGVKKAIRGDQHTVKVNDKSSRKRRGQYCVLLDDSHANNRNYSRFSEFCGRVLLQDSDILCRGFCQETFQFWSSKWG